MNDPRFPNRPGHHDFVRLSAVVIEADDRTDRGESVPAVMEGLIDLDSVTYMAEGRIKLMTHRLGRIITPDVRTMMEACWLDAFRAGVRFQQEGGHTNG
jgi:hypothetical protein